MVIIPAGLRSEICRESGMLESGWTLRWQTVEAVQYRRQDERSHDDSTDGIAWQANGWNVSSNCEDCGLAGFDPDSVNEYARIS